MFGACISDPDQPPAEETVGPVGVLYRGSRFPASQPGLRLIRDSASWAEWQKQRKKMSFVETESAVIEGTNLDFGEFDVIVISMGQKPTPLYSVDVPKDSATLHGTVLTISAVWQRPPEGAILAQVITSPCIAITVPKTPYDSVRVENQNGDLVIDQQT
jgi:hypothetical protein